MRFSMPLASLALVLAASPALAHPGHGDPADAGADYAIGRSPPPPMPERAPPEGPMEPGPMPGAQMGRAPMDHEHMNRGAMPQRYRSGFDPAARDAWLVDCRQRVASHGHATAGTMHGRDECEAYLDNYYARYTQGGYAAGYGQPIMMAQPMMMVPVMMVPVMMVPVATPKKDCVETVEYVYEDVPVRSKPAHRYISKRVKIVPDKRIKLVPDKRVVK